MCSEVVGVSMGTRVLMLGNVWDGEEVMRKEHMRGHPHTEFLYLAMDVVEEGIAGPVANQHDSENWHPSKVHMAAPNHIEWVPMLPGEYPNLASPRNDTAAQMWSRSILEVIAIISIFETNSVDWSIWTHAII